METKSSFFLEDRLSLIVEEKGSNHTFPVSVTQVDPLTVDVLTPMSESSLNRLNAAASAIIADTKRGYAYKTKIASVQGDRIVLSLMERHELREHFRTETVMLLGYELIHRSSQASGKQQDNQGSMADLIDKLGNVSQFEKSMGTLMLSMVEELKGLREQVKESSQGTNSQDLSQRVVNLSGSGIKFTGQMEHFKGDLLRIYLSIPERTQPIVTEAKVIRVDTEFGGSGGSNSSIACTFTTISESDRESLIRHVFQTQRRNLSRRSGLGIGNV